MSIGVLLMAGVALGLQSSFKETRWIDELRSPVANAYQRVTGDDSEEDRLHWDRLFDTGAYIFGKEPAQFLMQNVYRLQPGRVLDIAMGEGRNAVFLARRGFEVEGVDISEVALRKAKRLAKENQVQLTTILADLSHYEIKPETYDVILNFDYLQRDLISKIKHGLKKGGIVIYENDTTDQVTVLNRQNLRRDHLLKPGELKSLFHDFEILFYSENNDGAEAKASLIAQKPIPKS